MTTETTAPPQEARGFKKIVRDAAVWIGNKVVTNISESETPSQFSLWLQENLLAPVLDDENFREGTADLINRDLANTVDEARDSIPNAFESMKADLPEDQRSTFNQIKDNLSKPTDRFLKKAFNWFFAKGLNLTVKLSSYVAVAFASHYYKRPEVTAEERARLVADNPGIVIPQARSFSRAEKAEHTATTQKWFTMWLNKTIKKSREVTGGVRTATRRPATSRPQTAVPAAA